MRTLHRNSRGSRPATSTNRFSGIGAVFWLLASMLAVLSACAQPDHPLPGGAKRAATPTPTSAAVDAGRPGAAERVRVVRLNFSPFTGISYDLDWPDPHRELRWEDVKTYWVSTELAEPAPSDFALYYKVKADRSFRSDDEIGRVKVIFREGRVTPRAQDVTGFHRGSRRRGADRGAGLCGRRLLSRVHEGWKRQGKPRKDWSFRADLRRELREMAGESGDRILDRHTQIPRSVRRPSPIAETPGAMRSQVCRRPHASAATARVHHSPRLQPWPVVHRWQLPKAAIRRFLPRPRGMSREFSLLRRQEHGRQRRRSGAVRARLAARQPARV